MVSRADPLARALLALTCRKYSTKVRYSSLHVPPLLEGRSTSFQFSSNRLDTRTLLLQSIKLGHLELFQRLPIEFDYPLFLLPARELFLAACEGGQTRMMELIAPIFALAEEKLRDLERVFELAHPHGNHFLLTTLENVIKLGETSDGSSLFAQISAVKVTARLGGLPRLRLLVEAPRFRALGLLETQRFDKSTLLAAAFSRCEQALVVYVEEWLHTSLDRLTWIPTHTEIAPEQYCLDAPAVRQFISWAVEAHPSLNTEQRRSEIVVAAIFQKNLSLLSFLLDDLRWTLPSGAQLLNALPNDAAFAAAFFELSAIRGSLNDPRLRVSISSLRGLVRVSQAGLAAWAARQLIDFAELPYYRVHPFLEPERQLPSSPIVCWVHRQGIQVGGSAAVSACAAHEIVQSKGQSRSIFKQLIEPMLREKASQTNRVLSAPLILTERWSLYGSLLLLTLS